MTQRVDTSEFGETRDSLDQKLIEFIMACGGLPVLVPNLIHRQGCLTAWLEALSPDALVLSGGNDIGQSKDRDATEFYLLDFARDRLLPVLGICRGMQVMGVWAGGTLERIEGHVRTRHRLDGEIEGSVNSYHEFALDDLPSGFRELASDENGSIEAICHYSLPWEAWMWHPEREHPFNDRDIFRLRELLN